MDNDSLSWDVEQAPSSEVGYLGRHVDEEGRRRAERQAKVQRELDEERREHLNSIERARIAIDNTTTAQGEDES